MRDILTTPTLVVTIIGVMLKLSLFLDPEPAQITDYSAHDITIMKGDHARLLCVARGFPHPTITWKKDGRRIQVCLSHLPCRETDRYILWPNSLMIKDARYPDDDGVFSCHAKNDFGDDSISIVVVVPSKLKQKTM